MKHLDSILHRAIEHKGTSFVEIYQDCNIFNHKAWFYASQKDTKPETTILLEQGKPLIFGANRDKGIRFNKGKMEVVELGNGVSEDDLVVHDETDHSLAFWYAQMCHPEFPEPIGVLHANPSKPTYDRLVIEQVEASIAKNPTADLQQLIQGRETWEVK